MKILVLETLVNGRHDLIKKGREPPFVVHLSSRRVHRLREEMASLGVSFGIPFDGYVPDPKDDGCDYEYAGKVLEDVHVYGRVDR